MLWEEGPGKFLCIVSAVEFSIIVILFLLSNPTQQYLYIYLLPSQVFMSKNFGTCDKVKWRNAEPVFQAAADNFDY